jgi:hypothetical protein
MTFENTEFHVTSVGIVMNDTFHCVEVSADGEIYKKSNESGVSIVTEKKLYKFVSEYKKSSVV